MSFAEVLATLGLLALLAADAARFGQAALRHLERQSLDRDVHQSLAVTAEMFEREWRVAGFHAFGRPLVGFVCPSSQSIQLQADLNGDGDLSDAHEQIAYAWDAERRTVMRSTQSASPQPWLSDVPEGGFALRFFDRFGQEIPPERASGDARAVLFSLQVERSSNRMHEPLDAVEKVLILRARRNA